MFYLFLKIISLTLFNNGEKTEYYNNLKYKCSKWRILILINDEKKITWDIIGAQIF